MREVSIVINARLASSRCPQKLVRPFAGTTLIELALRKLSWIYGSEKYLAAGDAEIIDLYQPYSKDVKLLRREKDAIGPGEHPHSVSFRHYGDVPSDYILIMNPCMPFTRVRTYEKAIRYFQEHPEIMSLTSVLPFRDIFFDEDRKVITLRDVDHISTTTAKELYKMSHVFHIINKDVFLDTGRCWAYLDNDPAFMPVPKYECLDVDDEEDFEFCSKIYGATKWDVK